MDSRINGFNGERNYKYSKTPNRGVARVNVQLSKLDDRISIVNKIKDDGSESKDVMKNESQDDNSFNMLDLSKYTQILESNSTERSELVKNMINKEKRKISTKIIPAISKPSQIRIDKNHKFGKKHRFKPLEKLEEKHLQEDDSIDSIDLSNSYGPTYIEETHIKPIEYFSSPDKPPPTSNNASPIKRQYDILTIDKSLTEHIRNPQTQRHTPNHTFDSSTAKYMPITPKANNSRISRKRPVATQPKRGDTRNKHSLGLPI
jgi:hypothetical protein